MLQIKKYDFTNLDQDLINRYRRIDKKIKKELVQLRECSISNLTNFFSSLENIISIDVNSIDSFVMADLQSVEDLKKIIPSNICFKRRELTNDVEVKELLSNVNNSSLSPDQKKKLDESLNLNTYLDSIFNYSGRKDRLVMYYSQRETSNCHYCLAQYTTIYSGKEKKYLKGNLDHIYPKSKNALISVSLNNLVPVCAHCNQRKLDADELEFNFNPLDKIKNEATPTFNFKNVLEIKNGNVDLKKLNGLEIKNINPTLESRLELTSLYKEYKIPIWNLLERYKKFNSVAYQQMIEDFITDNNIPSTKKDISDNLEYFISETPYTDENIQNIPLHKFKSDFYKELEEYKKEGKIKFIS